MTTAPIPILFKLVLQLRVSRDDDREAGLDRRAKEHTIPQAEPTLASIRRYISDGEFFGQFDRQGLIDEYSQLR